VRFFALQEVDEFVDRHFRFSNQAAKKAGTELSM